MRSVDASGASVALRVAAKHLAEKRNDLLKVEYDISRLRLELGRLEERQPSMAWAVRDLTARVAKLTAEIKDAET